METRLIKKLSPHHDESGLGYYRRLSAANGLSGWRELARLSEVSTARSGLFNRPEHVAKMLGLDSAACQLASALEEIALGWRGMRRVGFDAVCPHCLKESAYLRLGWDHVYAVACPVHKNLLVDKCEACGQRLLDTRERIDECPCGHCLSASTTTPATSAQLWLASLIVSRDENHAHLNPALENAHVDLVGFLARNLCQLHDLTRTVVRQNAAAPKTVLESIEFLRPLESLLHEWPQGFRSHVRDRIAHGPKGARTLNTKLGKWYVQLRILGIDAAENPFLDAVHQLASEEYSSVLALDHVEGVSGRTPSHFNLPEAAARMGVHRATLVKAIATGEVASIQRPYANRGMARKVATAEVQAIASSRAGWISEAKARDQLGVPESVFEYMVQAGLIRPDYSARYDIRRGAPIEASAVERLQAKMLATPLKSGPPSEATLCLREFHARRLGDKKAILRLLKAIVAGGIHPVGRGTCAGDLEFSEDDLTEFFTSRSADAGLTVQALARATGWKWESISHWIDEGLLESTPAVLRGQACRVVMPEHLLKFNQAFIPLSSLAHALNTRSSDLIDRLGGVQILGGKPLKSGAMRGGLVRMKDLASAALRGGPASTTSSSPVLAGPP
jgi:hypothetical protein